MFKLPHQPPTAKDHTSYDNNTNRGALSGKLSCNSSNFPDLNVNFSPGIISCVFLSMETATQPGSGRGGRHIRTEAPGAGLESLKERIRD